MKDKWLDEIRESLSDYEVDAPEGLWESLGIEETVTRTIWRRKLATAVAAIAILIIGIGYLLWLSPVQQFDSDMIKIAATHTAAHQTKTNISQNHETASTHNEIPISKPIKKVDLALSLSDNTEDTVPLVAYEEVSIASSDSIQDNAEGMNEKEFFMPTSHTGLPPKKKRQTYADDRYALAISASGIGSTSERTVNPGSIPGFNDPLYGGNNDANGIPDINSPIIGDGAENDEIIDIHHLLPVKLGITLQYKLTQRFSIESGLTYTGLESDISVSKGNATSGGTRKLHYVGIPVNVKFTAWSWKFINVYLSAGVAGEKCISNRFEIKSISEGADLDVFDRQREKPFQYSVNASGGLQLSPTPNIGIFAEPGVSYYFNDGSSISTIYKEHPCNFNLNLGIRFTLNP